MSNGAPRKVTNERAARTARARLPAPVRRSLRGLRRAHHELIRERLPGYASRVRGVLQPDPNALFEGLSPEAALHARRNFRLGVVNGVLFGLSDALMAASFVLALFLNRLGAPNILVGLVPAILTGGGFLPQLLVASKVQGRRKVMPWYWSMSVIRVTSIALVAVSCIVFADNSTALLWAFFALFSIYSFAAGVSTLPWYEMVAKVISPRRRGTFFSLRSFWGGVLALLAAGYVGAVLSERLPGLKFPYNFALLFAISALVIGLAMASWASVKEPEAAGAAQSYTLPDIVRRGLQAVKVDRDYRSFMVARVLLALATIADPFYVVYARHEWNAPAEAVGLYLGASSAAVLASNFIWGPLGDRAGNRLLMTLTVLAIASVPLAALIITFLRPAIGLSAAVATFTLVFVLGGLAIGSGRIVNNNMLLAIAPPAERAIYIGFLNTLLGIVTFVPPFGGALVDLVGFVPLFGLTLVIAASALFASLRLSPGAAINAEL